jgi:pSer/pThr/pTyr-binding forkhead associated (FHA) protein
MNAPLAGPDQWVNSPMHPLLVALTDGPNITLDKPILLVGRHQECDVLIPSRKISRRHCCIAQVHDAIAVKDLFSTNGVRVNGVRVREGVLHAGDELTIGNYRYKIEMPVGSSASPLAKLPVVAPPQQLPQLAPADQAESCDVPMALAEDPRQGPVPHGRPLVLPVGPGLKPHGNDNPFAENIKRASGK